MHNIEYRKASQYSQAAYVAITAEKRISLTRDGKGWRATVEAPHWQHGVQAQGLTRQLATQAAIIKAEQYTYAKPH